MTAALEWSHKNGIPENLSVAEWARRMDELTGARHHDNEEPEVAAARWLNAIAIFSTTDQQLPPCDTEFVTFNIEPRTIDLADGGETEIVLGDPGSRTAKPNPDHIWRCVEQAAKGQ